MPMIIDALVLGLASGTSCIATCAPVVLPFLFSREETDAGSNALRVALILAGRLVGYIIVGFIMGGIGALAASQAEPAVMRTIGRLAYAAAGTAMIAAGLLPALRRHRCPAFAGKWGSTAAAFFLGLVTGFSLCPPFIAAAARVFGTQSSLEGALFFLLFFLGTSVYFLPLLGVSFFRKYQDRIRIVARISCVLIGAYYIVFFSVIGG